MTLVLFLFFLGLLIFIHELGHFLFARKLGAVVEEFSIGFPPRIFSRKTKKTVYSIGIIPFGGFVKLKGDEDPNDLEGFLFLPPFKKLLIVLGGIIFNLILAYFLFSLSFLWGYPKLANKIIVTGIHKDSLVKDFLKVGDEIVKVEMEDKAFVFKNPQEFSRFLKDNPSKKITVFFLRNNQEYNFQINIPSSGILGIYLGNFVFEKASFPLNFFMGLEETIKNLFRFLNGFFVAIKVLIFKEKISMEIVGPVGIYSLFDNIQTLGIGYLLYFVGVISLNLAIVNTLPFPGLDGGRIIFLLYEIFSQKRINYQKEKIVHQIGIAFLFIFLFFVTLKDIYKLWSP